MNIPPPHSEPLLLPPKGCQNAATLGTDYAGTANTTKSGRTCQAWNSNYPHKQNTDIFKAMKKVVGNPCRNPSRSAVGLWCYTMDPKKNWEACDIPTCTTTGKSLAFHYNGLVLDQYFCLNFLFYFLSKRINQLNILQLYKKLC